MVISPRDSAKFIASQAKHIQIIDSGIETLGDILVSEIKSGKLSPDNFSQTEVHPHPNDPLALDWLFLVDTLNFCFWHNENEEGWKVDGYTGYYALCAAINRAQREEVNILDPNFYSVITEAQLKKVLRSDTDVECPLISERTKCLHEVGNILIEKFEGSFENVVKQSKKSASKLLELVIDNFSCFRDEATFHGKEK
ncbi:hypothetical protein JTB14_012433 [Gonioctena quinquepunctata]|nr:hypothetical protein JTB14_012433 [Gonioctena quinquepunctata]